MDRHFFEKLWSACPLSSAAGRQPHFSGTHRHNPVFVHRFSFHHLCEIFGQSLFSVSLLGAARYSASTCVVWILTARARRYGCLLSRSFRSLFQRLSEALTFSFSWACCGWWMDHDWRCTARPPGRRLTALHFGTFDRWIGRRIIFASSCADRRGRTARVASLNIWRFIFF